MMLVNLPRQLFLLAPFPIFSKNIFWCSFWSAEKTGQVKNQEQTGKYVRNAVAE
jgi:hypothetical protein